MDYPDRPRALDGVDEPDGGAVQDDHVHRLGDLPVELLQERVQRLADVEPLQDGERHSGQRRAGEVDLRTALLPHEPPVLQHRQQPVRGGRGDPQVLRDLGEPQLAALTEQQQDPQGVVHRLDRVRRPLPRGNDGVETGGFLHSRNSS
jgi:hypothetical protein